MTTQPAERHQPVTTSQNLKITLHGSIDQYPMVVLGNQKIVLKKGTTFSDLREKPLTDILECVL